MFETGFLGTRAPLFMDIVTLIVTLLPLLIAGAIFLAKKQKYNQHQLVQIVIFWVSFFIIGYFETGVRMGGGFETFMKGSQVSHSYAFWVLILHIIIATLTLLIWTATLFLAWRQKRLGILPGYTSLKHKKLGMTTFIGITLTSLTGLWVYLLLFVY